MIFRLSQKLNAKLKAGELAAMPLVENPFADWSAHVFVANRKQHLLVTNTKSLYSIVMHGKGVTDGGAFVEQVLSHLRSHLADDGQPFAYRRYIGPAAGAIRFARALDRKVTGTMNDLIAAAKFWLLERGLTPEEIGFKLNETPYSSLKYSYPREMFTAMQVGQPAADGNQS